MIMATYEERPDLIAQVDEFIPRSWPAFMLKDPVAGRLWHHLETTFAAFQFTLRDGDGRVAAMGNTIPFAWNGAPAGLPDHGWDGVFEQAVRDHAAGRAPDALSALQAVVAPGCQGRGLSRLVIDSMKEIGRRHGLARLVAPVRPSLKAAYPLTPIERYVEWRRADGAPLDPWMRTHWRQGARVVRIAGDSMRITGTVPQWEQWTAMQFPDSGEYIVPGALTPVIIDRSRDEGCYIEPNVWMQHPAPGH